MVEMKDSDYFAVGFNGFKNGVGSIEDSKDPHKLMLAIYNNFCDEIDHTVSLLASIEEERMRDIQTSRFITLKQCTTMLSNFIPDDDLCQQFGAFNSDTVSPSDFKC